MAHICAGISFEERCKNPSHFSTTSLRRRLNVWITAISLEHPVAAKASIFLLQFIITIEGRGGKFNLKNTILNVGSGLALLGVTTVVCDFLLMYIKERRMIKQKK